LLAFIEQIRKIEVLLLGPLLHLREAVIWDFRDIVGIDDDQLHALRAVVRLYLHHTILPRFHVGAMVAAEDHHHGVFVLVVGERMLLVVDTRQGKGFACSLSRIAAMTAPF
jgi:hypothetical protein